MPTRLWRNEFIVNTTSAGSQDQSSVTALADGGFVIAWRDDGPADSVIRFQRYDATGLKVGGEITDSLAFVPDQLAPAITQLADGSLLIVRDVAINNDIKGIVQDFSGTAIRTENAVLSWPLDVESPDVASLGANGDVMVWRADTNAGSDIYFSSFNASGTARFQALPVIGGNTASAEDAPDVAANSIGNRYAVAWTNIAADAGNISVRVFGADGADITTFTANAVTADTQSQPQIAWLDSGRMVVTWTTLESLPPLGDVDGTAIHYAIYNEFGFLLDAERLANSTVIGGQQMSAVTSLADGGFVIAWEDSSTTGGDSSGGAIRLQVFDGAGDKLGKELLVNTTTAGVQDQISLTTLADGRIVVSWTDNADGIHSQIVDPRDGVVDGTGGADKLYGHDAVGDIISGYDGADLLFGFGGTDVMYGGAGADNLNGGKGDDGLYGGQDNDVLLGGAGDDDLFGEGGNDDLRGDAGADALDGGAGIDFANYNGAQSSVTVALDGTLASTGEAAGDTFISIEGLRGANIAGAGDTLRGNALGNTIFGLLGNDKLDGAGGLDKLVGGLGADTLTGGTSGDWFMYNAVNEGGDAVSDFASGADTFRLKGSAFAGLTAGTYSTANFVARADNAAQDGNDFFIFRTTDKTLWFDADGSTGGAANAIMIADLQAGATMVFSDIVIF